MKVDTLIQKYEKRKATLKDHINSQAVILNDEYVVCEYLELSFSELIDDLKKLNEDKNE